MKKAGIILILIASQLSFGQKEPAVQPFSPDVLMPFPNVRDFTASAAEDGGMVYRTKPAWGDLCNFNDKKEKWCLVPT